MKKWTVIVFLLLLASLLNGCGETDPSAQDSATIALGWGESYVYSIPEGEFSSYMAGKVIDQTQIDGKICDVSVEAGWRNNTDGTMLSRETLRGEVYSIRGISTRTAVALKFLDQGEAVTTTHYYVILNPQGDLTGMEEYIIAPMVPNYPGDE